MSSRSEQLSREEECARILKHYGDNDFERISEALDKHFLTIHNRAQVLLGICGVLISASVLVTTGRFIGQASFEHQHLAGRILIIAGALEITAAGILVAGVLRVRWITKEPGEELRRWILSVLAYRDAKTKAYRVSTVLVLLSMVAYQVGIAIALAQL